MKAAEIQRAAILLQARKDVDDALRGLDESSPLTVGQFPGLAIVSGVCQAAQSPLPSTGWLQVDRETGHKVIEAARAIIGSELAKLGVE